MNDTDVELERRLRVHFRDARAADGASLALRADVNAIPRTSGVARRRGWARRHGLTLLAATLALGIGAAGWALIAGGRLTEPPRPSPKAIIVAPSPSEAPAETAPASPSPTATVDGTEPGVAAGWTAAGTMAEPRILPTATLLQDGRVLVVGGIASDGTSLASAELWDPATRQFSPAGTLSRPRPGHAAALLQDGRVLIVGGDNELESIPAPPTEVWDPATGEFTKVGTMPALPSGLTATTLTDGRVLIVRSDFCLVATVESELSGYRRCPTGQTASSILWSPDGTAVVGPEVLESREWHTATLLPDGRVLLVGNSSWSSDDPESSEIYDPATNAFVRMDETRDLIEAAQTATLLRDGRVLVTGGDTSEPNGDPQHFGPLRNAETWDPASGTFERAGAMKFGRRAHQAALLPDGRVIVIGGSGKRTDEFVDPSRATTEIWDPATGTFQRGPALSDARARFSLVTLSDGSLLVIGGDARLDTTTDRGRALASAEILDVSPSN